MRSPSPTSTQALPFGLLRLDLRQVATSTQASPDPLNCTCGYAAGTSEAFRDHLEEMFAADDDRGPDGQLHAEAARPGSLCCLCGFAAGGPDELDAHIVRAFTPADGVGRDGKAHVLARR
jgi:hypothetical protein